MKRAYEVTRIRKYYCAFHINSEKSLMYSIIYATNQNEAFTMARKKYGFDGGIAGVYTESFLPKIQVFKMKLFEEVPHEKYGKGEYEYKRRSKNGV